MCVVEVLDSWPTMEQKPRRDKIGSPAPWHANVDESGTKGTKGTKGTDKGTGGTTRNRDRHGSPPANISKENKSPPSQGGHILTRSSTVNDPLLRSLRNPYGGSTWTSHPSDTAEETLRSASRKLAPPPRNSPARKEAPHRLLETRARSELGEQGRRTFRPTSARSRPFGTRESMPPLHTRSSTSGLAGQSSS